MMCDAVAAAIGASCPTTHMTPLGQANVERLAVKACPTLWQFATAPMR
jgi:hypothetical protein